MNKFASLLVLAIFLAPALAVADSECGDNLYYDAEGDVCLTANGSISPVTPTTGITGSNGISGQQGQSSGAGGINDQYIKGYATSIVGIINGILVPLLTAVAFIVFLYGVFNYFIKGAADEDAHKTGRTFIIYGIIGFVVIFSVWGLVGIVTDTLSLPSGGTHPTYPTL